MPQDQNCRDTLIDLRRKAEGALREKIQDTPDVSSLSLQYIGCLIHELQVRQIELEMQNEELLRAQRELHALREKYADLYDLAPFGYFLLDTSGGILEANLTGAGLLNVDRGSLAGTPLSFFVHSDDAKSFHSYLQRLKDTNTRRICHVRITKRDGAPFHARLESVAVRDCEGRLTGLRTVIFDITAQKKAEDNANEMEAQFRAMIEAFDGFIYVCSSDHEIEFVNERLIQRTGHDPTGEKCYHALHDLEEICPWCCIEQVMRGETLRWKVQSPKDKRWYSSINTPVRHQDGTIAKMAMIEDITECKQAENILRESEQRFRTIFDNPHTVMLIIDPESGRIEDASLGACAFYGYSRNDLKKKTIADISVLSSEEVFEKIQMARFQHCKYFDFQHRLANGELRHVEVCSGPIVIGGRTLLLSVVNDVTEREQTQEALRKSEKRYRELFDNAPISIMEEDFSEAKAHFDKLRVSGVEDFQAYFRHHPAEVARCASLVKKLEVNQETATLFQAATKQDVPLDLTAYFEEESWNIVREGLAALAEGKTRFQDEISVLTLAGEKRTLALRLSVCEGYEKTLERVLLCLIDVTKRKQAEAKLEKSVSLLRSTLEATADGILVVNRDRRIVSFNQRLLNMWHVPGDIVEARDAVQAITFALGQVKNPQAFVDKLKELYECAESEEFDVLEFNDGSVFECYSRPQYMGGKIIGRVLSFRDVTDRKKAEKALRESQQSLELALSCGEIGLWDKNVETGEIVIDQRWTDSLGYPVKSHRVNCKMWSDLIHPDDLPHVTNAMDAHLAGKAPLYESEYRLRAKSGEWKWILDRGKVVERDPMAKPLRVVGAYLDVTDRKRSEEALRESELRNHLLVEESPVGIIISEEGRLAFINPSCLQMLGYESPDQVLGLPITDLVAPEDRGFVEKLQENRWAGRRLPLSFELKALKQSGEELDLAVWPREIDRLGAPTTLVFVADRTEEKSLKAQLTHSQKMEALGTLAGGIAHDFNNLLTVILGYSDLIMSEKDKQDSDYQDLEKVVHAARSAGDMIQQILAFSRKTETKMRPTNLNRQVEQLQKMLSRLIHKTIDVDLSLARGLPMVNADPSQIDQVLMNLAVNARDAMPAGGRLTIETGTTLLDDDYCRSHIEAHEGRHVVLVVSDTGVGIDKTSLDRVFEPFYTTKSPGEGTGLGLATVYGIVKGHGGHIVCESEPGLGTTFRIYFPVYTAEAESDAGDSQEYSPSGFGTILLVDDEEFVRSLAQRILEKSGYRVLTADNGRQAVDIYRQKHAQISLVVLDLIMPVMDGKQCLEEMLEIDPGAKVLMASGHSPDEVTRGVLERGAKGFVGKPYDAQAMLQVIREILSES